MHRIYALLVCCVVLTLGSCQARQDLNELVTKPVFKTEPTKAVYLADTALRLTIPTNLAVKEERHGSVWVTDSMVYSFQRDGQQLCRLYLGKTDNAPLFAKSKGTQRISIGLWRGLLFETAQEGKLSGELFIGVREGWFARFCDSLGQKLRDLRARFKGRSKGTEEDLKKCKEGVVEGERVFKNGVIEG